MKNYRSLLLAGLVTAGGVFSCGGGSGPNVQSGGAGGGGTDDSSASGGAEANADGGADSGGSESPGKDEPTPLPGRPFVYLGGYNNLITVLLLDPVTGELEKQSDITVPNSPSFLAVAPSRKFLYAGLEGGPGAAQAFAIDQATGALSDKGSRGGDTAAHIAIDNQGRFAATASYSKGSVTIFPIANDGTLGPSSSQVVIAADSRAHQVEFSPDHRFLFVPAVQAKSISQFALSDAGVLSFNEPPQQNLTDDPRHVRFHPNGRFVYAINESAFSIQSFSYDATQGTLTSIQDPQSTLPPGSDEEGSCAEIQVSPDGRFVYGSNRLADKEGSIVRFGVDETTGKLTYLGETSSGGRTPRHFSLDSTGQYLLAANQGEAGVVAVFGVNRATGELSFKSSASGYSGVSWAGVVYLP